MAEEIFKPGKALKKKAYLPGGGLPVVNMTGDPRGSRLLHWAMTLECCNPWRIFLRGYLYRIIFFRGGVACGPPNPLNLQTPKKHEYYCYSPALGPLQNDKKKMYNHTHHPTTQNGWLRAWTTVGGPIRIARP